MQNMYLNPDHDNYPGLVLQLLPYSLCIIARKIHYMTVGPRDDTGRLPEHQLMEPLALLLFRPSADRSACLSTPQMQVV